MSGALIPMNEEELSLKIRSLLEENLCQFQSQEREAKVGAKTKTGPALISSEYVIMLL